jgi:hypothetical protein
MEQTTLPSTSSVPTSLPTSSLSSPDKIARAIQSFGDEYREMVFCKYQKPMVIKKAVSEKAPTFHDVTNFWGEESTKFWLRFHIAETFAFLGIYDTASKYQVQHTADLIMQHEIFGQLTLSEFLCFLQRFKMGEYGKIYQSNRPNPQEFLACLRPFWNELCLERGKQAEKERQERISKAVHDPSNITKKEWIELKIITAMYNSDYVVTKNDFDYLDNENK